MWPCCCYCWLLAAAGGGGSAWRVAASWRRRRAEGDVRGVLGQDHARRSAVRAVYSRG
ncbi:hypothetical protein PR003_g1269 [Phytophthora rubi]|uniref:RxLR effector protein n=1 Tax=Phytophthora rubi TaxID=129364 RepID=A0A6A3NZY6_9STRA|nr:hypothetical protein PR002_g3887 [Phytophthora rubi]KAE9048752.1 hypothetical protein PR001_g3700 [Phytophthora rubi]KAE9358467.1 hypothetical protein PR003_g1269 [Phytophthora rubi]